MESHRRNGGDVRCILIRLDFTTILTLWRADIHAFSVDQEGMEGIPTGRHWIEIAEQIQGEPAEIRQRFEEKYFRYERIGESVHIRGTFAYALVCGQKS